MIPAEENGFDAEEYAKAMEKAKKQVQEEALKLEKINKENKFLARVARRFKFRHRSHISGRTPHNKEKEK